VEMALPTTECITPKLVIAGASNMQRAKSKASVRKRSKALPFWHCSASREARPGSSSWGSRGGSSFAARLHQRSRNEENGQSG
jgi:hypothetical protein